jgi:2-dehydro-3-deoxy-D-arabinonate dehydratase
LKGRRVIRWREADGELRLGVLDSGESTWTLELPLIHGDPNHVGGVVSALERLLTLDRLEEDHGFHLLDEDTLELPSPRRLLAPINPPETWCAGVTYERSRDARVEETQVQDVYSLVYDASRPELFMKDAGGRRTVGPEATVGVRSDSAWTVPEPELAVVLGRGKLLGVTIGNDVTARDVESENPLYLPQAKVYAAACAIGPAILMPEDWTKPFDIECRILDGDEVVWQGKTSTRRMKRSFDELVEWATRENPIPAGSVLLTGTGLVPPDEVALRAGHTVEVKIGGIGTLRNPVGAAVDLMTRRS